MTLDFIFRLVLYSHEDISFSIICLYVWEHQTVFLYNVLQENRLEIPFKCDNVKALIKTSIYENLVLYFSKKVQKIRAIAMLFWLLVIKQSLENGVGFPQ